LDEHGSSQRQTERISRVNGNSRFVWRRTRGGATATRTIAAGSARSGRRGDGNYLVIFATASRQLERMYSPALLEYERITSFHEINPNAL
jgi:hypothetical protein